ncbi:outer membrane protein assembly factor BamB family protein [Haloarcula sp. CGMCC 1.2071]|uniref:outer membrane protein assembly factor BamB family protein n=1 Tax=Haloarcula sp. CGMCC 1.2071 TaxID=3111454 RepID=UPI00300EF030
MQRRKYLLALSAISGGCLSFQEEEAGTATPSSSTPEKSAPDAENSDIAVNTPTETESLFEKSNIDWSNETTFRRGYFNHGYFYAVGGDVIAMDPSTGFREWRFRDNRPAAGINDESFSYTEDLVLAPSYVYENGSDETAILYALNQSGEKVWEFDTVGKDISPSPVHSSNHIILASDNFSTDGAQEGSVTVYCVDLAGNPVWDTTFDSEYILNIAAFNNRVYISVPGDGVTVLDIETGDTIAGSLIDSEYVRFHQYENYLFLLSEEVFKYDLRSDTIIWRSGQIGRIDSINTKVISEVSGQLLLIADGKIKSISRKNGDQKWEYASGDSVKIQNSPLEVSDNYLWAVDEVERIHAVKYNGEEEFVTKTFGTTPGIAGEDGKVIISDRSADETFKLDPNF